MTSQRQFIVTINYKSDAADWDVISHDVIEAQSLTELVTKFNLVLMSLHRRLLAEVKLEHGIDDDDIPF